MYSDPMPGENLESAEAREKALAEAAAIANGENFNPNIDSETANAFENLSNEVPFAGDNPETPSIENPVTEDKNETPPEDQIAENDNTEMQNQVTPNTETIPNIYETTNSEERQKYDGDNPISKEFNRDWNAGQSPNIENIKENVDANYISGASEQASTNADVEADIAKTELNIADGDNKENADKPHDISEAATISAISAETLAEDIEDKIKAGDEEAMAQIDEVAERATKAENLADKIASTTQEGDTDNTEAKMAISVAEQAKEMAEKATEMVEQAKEEYDSMSPEEKAETQAAAEAAEERGTTVEVEKKRLEQEKKIEDENTKPDVLDGIFS